MPEVLYRKYRPRRFADVLSQQAVKTVLQNALKTGRISHAYLFTGPRGVGKTTVARILAKAVNCLGLTSGEPDTTCENCVLQEAGRFLDLLEIDAASYTGVDNIREIIDQVRFAPAKGKYKVFIIDEVHMLSKAAFNALLKTLEEPPAHAVFILATTEIHKVPATIVSRTQRFDFKSVSRSEILSLLSRVVEDQKWEISPAVLQLICSAAGGSFRDALSILDQLRSFADQNITLEDAETLLGATRVDVLQKFLDLLITGDRIGTSVFVKDLAFAGKDITQFIKNFLEYLYSTLLVKMGASDTASLGLGQDDEERLSAQSKQLSGSRLLEIIRQMLVSYREIKFSPVPELPLLVAVMNLCPEDALSKSTPAKLQVPAVTTPSVQSSTVVNLDLGKIIDRWSEVLSKVKEYNHSLISSLRLGRVVGLEGNELTLAFPYSFHKDAIDARKNRIVVEQVLGEVFGQKLKVKVCLERELPGAGGSVSGNGDLLGEAMKVLGG